MVKDEPEKFWNLHFSVYFFQKWAETFTKLQLFTFNKKQCFSNTFIPVMVWETDIKKKKNTCNHKLFYLKKLGEI